MTERDYEDLLDFESSDRFGERQKAALLYTSMLVWNPEGADEAVWARLREHFTEEHKAQFETLLAAMDAACDAEDGTLYYELNLQFHALILVISNNRRAHQAYDDYVKELHLVRRKYFNVPGNMRRSNVEHRAIFDAIVASNRSRARAAAEKHVHLGRARLLANFEEPAKTS